MLESTVLSLTVLNVKAKKERTSFSDNGNRLNRDY